MLNDITVVQSAISAFNNAALAAPAFLWLAILAMPLFVVAYWCHDTIVSKIGWSRDTLLDKVSVWSAGLTLLWTILFSGNYGVLRDSLSVLPMMTAAIIFLTSLFVSSHIWTRALPKRAWLFILLLIIVTGLSDVHTWWGPLLQIGALMLGGLLGRFARGEMRPIAGTILISLTVATAILMQPEFFRFGQLGNLTVLHLLAILFLGISSMATVALMNVRACGKCRPSVYSKLKWLLRVMCALSCALFILTEAVPVFIASLIMLFILFAMSVYHAKMVNVALGHKMFAIVLMTFGVLTVMPVITVLGIVYWCNTASVNWRQDIKFLL